MDVVYILNPAAGNAPSPDRLQQLAAIAGLPGAVRSTQSPGHATHLAHEAASCGAAVVIAVGGDGTANEVAAGLLGTPAALAVLPAGSGNDFAREIGMPRGWRHALAALPRARRRRIDVGRANGRPFIQAAGAGLDAYVNELRRRERLFKGPLAYAKCAIQGLLTYAPVETAFVLDGRRWSARVLAVTVANGRDYGGGMRIAPGARNDDGALDVAIVGDAGRLEALRMFPTVYLGTHVNHPKVSLWQATFLTLETAKPVPVHVDGNPHGTTPVRITVEPAALEVLSLT